MTSQTVVGKWLRPGPLEDIFDKVSTGQRISREDGIRLMESSDLVTIGYLANLVRERMHQDNVYFTSNTNLNQTDYCVLYNNCKFCAFAKKIGEGDGFILSMDDVAKKVEEGKQKGIREYHIVGGLHPDLKIEYFEDMFRTIKRVDPQATVKALTAVEIDYIAKLSRLTIKDVLLRLREAGLDFLPGGGAEIFAPHIRERICPGKMTGERWLEIHRVAHELNFKSNATLLYGHYESAADRIDHMLALRDLQDQTGGFLAFVPLEFQPENTQMQDAPQTTGLDDLKVYAVSRIVLDNFPHIKLLYRYVGWRLSEPALSFGVDDLGGTSFEEKVALAAGGKSSDTYTRDAFYELIRGAGRIPVEVDSAYSPVGETASVVPVASPAKA